MKENYKTRKDIAVPLKTVDTVPFMEKVAMGTQWTVYVYVAHEILGSALKFVIAEKLNPFWIFPTHRI